MSNFPAAKLRLQKEAKELMDRIQKLKTFIQDNPTYGNLDPLNRELLNVQYNIMKSYHNVLCIRIERFKEV